MQSSQAPKRDRETSHRPPSKTRKMKYLPIVFETDSLQQIHKSRSECPRTVLPEKTGESLIRGSVLCETHAQ